MGLLEQLEAPELAEGAVEPDLGEMVELYDRVSRALRRCMALSTRLQQAYRDWQGMSAGARASKLAADARDAKADSGPKADREQRREQRKSQVKAAVEQVIRAEADGADKERLLHGLHERLDAPDWECGGLSDTEIIALICRDLGITPDWRRWNDLNWSPEAKAGDERGKRPDQPPGDPPKSAPPPDPVRRDDRKLRQ